MSAILLSVRDLHNYEVYDRHGEKLGVIDDFVLDIDDASVRYAVLASSSTFGLTNKKMFAVPLGALVLDTENECFVLDIDRERLVSANGFDADSTPESPDPLFAKGISSH
jgi:sporulation protein YlmC with PRC-barrel domain